ncbi:hypothetical protein FK515_29945, partial [Klebsiella pneumoniae]|nr:hypothetical protein [Klebsiella pneumoniae]
LPNDCCTLAQIILTSTQRMLWQQSWRDHCEGASLENLTWQLGDPLYADVDVLMGEGALALHDAQLQIICEALVQRQNAALWALLTFPDESGTVMKSFATIKQEATEP